MDSTPRFSFLPLSLAARHSLTFCSGLKLTCSTNLFAGSDLQTSLVTFFRLFALINFSSYFCFSYVQWACLATRQIFSVRYVCTIKNYVKNCSVYIQCKGDIVVVDIKQHKSQFKNSNITITQCQKNFADCVMVKFKFLNCDLCCFISTTTMSPLHCI